MNNPATIAFKCESCGQAMRAKAEYAGRKTACQNCKTVMEIPRTLQVPNAPRSTSRPVPPGPAAPGPAAPGPAAYGTQNYPGHTQSNYPPAPSPPYQPQSGYASQNYPGPNSFPGVGGYPSQPIGGMLPQPGYAAPAYPPNTNSPGNYAPGNYAPNQNSAASNYPNYPPAPASNVGESCPSCGSFFPPSLQTCPKCRFDRSTSKKLPYQNMMQPVAFSQPALPPPTPRSQSAFVESEIQWGVIGTGALMIFGAIVWFGLGLMGGIIFFYPIIMVFIGLGMIVKGLMGG